LSIVFSNWSFPYQPERWPSSVVKSRTEWFFSVVNFVTYDGDVSTFDLSSRHITFLFGRRVWAVQIFLVSFLDVRHRHFAVICAVYRFARFDRISEAVLVDSLSFDWSRAACEGKFIYDIFIQLYLISFLLKATRSRTDRHNLSRLFHVLHRRWCLWIRVSDRRRSVQRSRETDRIEAVFYILQVFPRLGRSTVVALGITNVSKNRVTILR